MDNMSVEEPPTPLDSSQAREVTSTSSSLTAADEEARTEVPTLKDVCVNKMSCLLVQWLRGPVSAFRLQPMMKSFMRKSPAGWLLYSIIMAKRCLGNDGSRKAWLGTILSLCTNQPEGVTDRLLPEIVSIHLDALTMKLEKSENSYSHALIGNPWDEIVRALGSKVEHHLIKLAHECMQNGNWAKRLAALTGLCSFAWYCAEEDQASAMMTIATRSLADSNVLVREQGFQLVIMIFGRVRFEESRVDEVLCAMNSALEVDGGGRVDRRSMNYFCRIIHRHCTKAIIENRYGEMMKNLQAILRVDRCEEYENLHEAAFKIILSMGAVVGSDRFEPDFLESFKCYVSMNPKVIISGTADHLDKCFACDKARPEVIMCKRCTIDSCGRCRCRPYWCCSCLGRIFLAGNAFSFTARCPFCNRNCCMNDVQTVNDVETDEAVTE